MTPVKTLLLDLVWTMTNTARGQKGETQYILKDNILQSSLGICHSVIFVYNTQMFVFACSAHKPLLYLDCTGALLTI